MNKEIKDIIHRTSYVVKSYQDLYHIDSEAFLYRMVGLLAGALPQAEFVTIHHILVEVMAFHMRGPDGEFSQEHDEQWLGKLRQVDILLGIERTVDSE